MKEIGRILTTGTTTKDRRKNEGPIPGRQSPYEWLIVLIWSIAGAVLYIWARAGYGPADRVSILGPPPAPVSFESDRRRVADPTDTTRAV